MGLLSINFFLDLLGIIIAIIGAVYLYLKIFVYHYWSSNGIVQLEPAIPVGNMWPVLMGQKSHGELIGDAYSRFKQNRIFGMYTFHKPHLIVCDLELIRFILTKEFSRFQDRGVYHDEKLDPMSANLFMLEGPKWIFLRAKFTPAFTTGKIKYTFAKFREIADNLDKYLADEVKKCDIIEVKDISARFTTDIIASIAFGIDGNSLKNPNAEFRMRGRRFFKPRPVVNILMPLCPALLSMFKVRYFDKESSDWIIKVVTEAVEYRTANRVVRKDFLDLVMQLINKGYLDADDDKKSVDESADARKKIKLLDGIALIFQFWLAGFETSSSAMSHCLYELALHPEIQEKLADEINTVLKKFGGLTYDSINEMTYLHKVLSETLRKYPSVPILNRECNQKVELPGTDFVIPKGTSIVVPVLGIHWDPDIYPDPEKFDPDRFNDESIAKRHRYAYLPFGEGPRYCIGMRIGLLQTKIGLITMLSKYRFKPTPNTKIPLIIDRSNFLLMAHGGIELQVEKR